MTNQTKEKLLQAAVADTMRSKGYPISTQDAFVHGAKTYLGIAWHDTASEEPEEGKDILLMFDMKDGKKAYRIGLYSENAKMVWVADGGSFHWYKLSQYSKWAYIDDLIPTDNK